MLLPSFLKRFPVTGRGEGREGARIPNGHATNRASQGGNWHRKNRKRPRERERKRERESSGLMEQTHSIPSLLSEFTAISFQDNLLA